MPFDDEFHDDRDYEDEPPRKRYRCGGFGAYEGPCGSPDCDSCYPGNTEEEPDENEPNGEVIEDKEL
jgi:hypothetical protein